MHSILVDKNSLFLFFISLHNSDAVDRRLGK